MIRVLVFSYNECYRWSRVRLVLFCSTTSVVLYFYVQWSPVSTRVLVHVFCSLCSYNDDCRWPPVSRSARPQVPPRVRRQPRQRRRGRARGVAVPRVHAQEGDQGDHRVAETRAAWPQLPVRRRGEDQLHLSLDTCVSLPVDVTCRHAELFVILAVISIYNSWLQNALYCTQKINNRKVSKEKITIFHSFRLK